MELFICLAKFSQLHNLRSVAVVKDDFERMLVEMFVACFTAHSELLCTGPRKTSEGFSQYSRFPSEIQNCTLQKTETSALPTCLRR